MVLDHSGMFMMLLGCSWLGTIGQPSLAQASKGLVVTVVSGVISQSHLHSLRWHKSHKVHKTRVDTGCHRGFWKRTIKVLLVTTTPALFVPGITGAVVSSGCVGAVSVSTEIGVIGTLINILTLGWNEFLPLPPPLNHSPHSRRIRTR